MFFLFLLDNDDDFNKITFSFISKLYYFYNKLEFV